jgi:hypothetical protein
MWLRITGLPVRPFRVPSSSQSRLADALSLSQIPQRPNYLPQFSHFFGRTPQNADNRAYDRCVGGSSVLASNRLPQPDHYQSRLSGGVRMHQDSIAARLTMCPPSWTLPGAWPRVTAKPRAAMTRRRLFAGRGPRHRSRPSPLGTT